MKSMALEINAACVPLCAANDSSLDESHNDDNETVGEFDQ